MEYHFRVLESDLVTSKIRACAMFNPAVVSFENSAVCLSVSFHNALKLFIQVAMNYD